MAFVKLGVPFSQLGSRVWSALVFVLDAELANTFSTYTGAVHNKCDVDTRRLRSIATAPDVGGVT
jgi:hypothetical protein